MLQTTWCRALMALVGGAIFGAVLISIYEVAFLLYPGRVESASGLELWLYKFPSTLLKFSVLMVVLGVPVFTLLHRTGFRSWLSFTMVGFMISSIIRMFSFIGSPNNVYKLAEVLNGRDVAEGFLLNLVVMPLIVAATALIIWFVAYKRPPSRRC